MQITHEEAHQLIQLNTDQALNPQKKAILSAHLKDCMECQAYAQEIREVENILVPVMKKHWNVQPIPLSTHTITSKRNSKLQASILLATRTAIIGLVFMSLVFTLWQFSPLGSPTPGQPPRDILPVPTPSGQTALSTSTTILFQNCAMILYEVQEKDTLESISDQFSISQEEIMALNHLPSKTVDNTMELMIRLCDSTPTGTVHPATLTTTYTPRLRQITSTPGG